MKTIGLMPRRADTTRAQFREHYEQRHAPLALGKFPFVKYVRNHVVESEPAEAGFDCLSEFWVNDVAEVQRIMAGEVGDIMREDERRFTDQPKIAPAVAEERHLFGPERPVEDGIVAKQILLLRQIDGSSRDQFVDNTTRWVSELVQASHGRLLRITFDTLTPFAGRYFPECHGVVYGWGAAGDDTLYTADPPQASEIYRRLKTESVETRF